MSSLQCLQKHWTYRNGMHGCNLQYSTMYNNKMCDSEGHFLSYIKTPGHEKRVNFLTWDIKSASSYRAALKIKVSCHVIWHYSSYIHAHWQHNLFSSGCVIVSCRWSAAPICGALDFLSAWLEHTSFKGGDKPSDFDGFPGNISQRACIPLSCGGTDRGWPNNLPIPSQEMQRRQKNV